MTSCLHKGNNYNVDVFKELLIQRAHFNLIPEKKPKSLNLQNENSDVKANNFSFELIVI